MSEDRLKMHDLEPKNDVFYNYHEIYNGTIYGKGNMKRLNEIKNEIETISKKVIECMNELYDNSAGVEKTEIINTNY